MNFVVYKKKRYVARQWKTGQERFTVGTEVIEMILRMVIIALIPVLMR